MPEFKLIGAQLVTVGRNGSGGNAITVIAIATVTFTGSYAAYGFYKGYDFAPGNVY
jgi:hypothetical protein